MAWTTPKTWAAEPLTSSDLNTYVRDNQNHVYNRIENNDEYTANEVSNYTTTSTSFVDVDATNLSLTITTNGGNVLAGFAGAGWLSSASESIWLELDIDGSPWAGDDGIMRVRFDNINYIKNLSFVVMVTGLSTASHTFKLQWKVDGGTGTIFAGAGTTDSDLHPQFWIQEI